MHFKLMPFSFFLFAANFGICISVGFFVLAFLIALFSLIMLATDSAARKSGDK